MCVLKLMEDKFAFQKNKIFLYLTIKQQTLTLSEIKVLDCVFVHKTECNVTLIKFNRRIYRNTEIFF